MAFEKIARETARINFGLRTAYDANYAFDILRAVRRGEDSLNGVPLNGKTGYRARQDFENLRDTAEIFIGKKAPVEMTQDGLRHKTDF